MPVNCTSHMRPPLIVNKGDYSWWRQVTNLSLQQVFNPHRLAFEKQPFQLTTGGVPLVRSYEDLHPRTLKGNFLDEPSRPLVWRQYHGAQMFAITRWFQSQPGAESQSSCTLNSEYLQKFGDHLVPVELSRGDQFNRAMMPLSVFLELAVGAPSDTSVYLAQCPIDDLPKQMQQDLPTPRMTTYGNRDNYSSSIWIGRAPTHTPFHRDPNYNVLVQLAGHKVVRLAEPDIGEEIYRQASIKDQGVKSSRMSARIRGEEMMIGPQREKLEQLVWRVRKDEDFSPIQKISEEDVSTDDARKAWDPQSGERPPGATIKDEERMRLRGLDNTLETTIGPGDALFIPRGWWHSVKGVGTGIVGSANWWFR